MTETAEQGQGTGLGAPLEIWGGLECTLNRVQDRYFDQLSRSGHLGRISADIAVFAELGLERLRYGMHWERFEATGSWAVFDEAAAAMQSAGIGAIAGLVHHGSGPESTSLLDEGFPEKLARYAGQVAARYPEIDSYTPINEPNTTARFSTLYGHWYPHHRSMRSYVRALYNEVKGTALAMRAIREVRSDAKLVYTEDGGKTWATPVLDEYRQEREYRRWLGTDLLCGQVDEGHPLFAFLLGNGLTEREVLWFQENACLPDVLGMNYYVTSDRFLDHRVTRYPQGLAGGDSGTEPLVDIEAVRVRPGGIAGSKTILTEAYERYGVPVAITEAHLGSTPEEQVRWLAEMWEGVQEARAEGVDCRAFTVWALLGSYDWCHLVTADHGVYEAGVFRISEDSAPQPTDLAEVVCEICLGKQPKHGALRQQGWWRKPSRILVPIEEEQEMWALES